MGKPIWLVIKVKAILVVQTMGNYLFLFFMRRYNNLFEQISSIENIEKAIDKASKGKREKKETQIVLAHKEKYVKLIKEMLDNGTYVHSKYSTHIIYEPKKREIFCLPMFPDRIIQHCLMNVLEPIWEKMFYFHSYSCIKGKGTHSAHLFLEKCISKYNWVLQCDVRKFYPSINHDVMKGIFRRKIKDKRVLHLLDVIVDSIEGEKNIPIGNYTSQWFGNLYLNELDDFIKHKLKLVEVRYCDDFILFSNDREELKTALKEIKKFLAERLKLELSKGYIRNARQGITAFGFKSFKNKKGKIITLIKKRTARKIKKFLTEEATLDKLDDIDEANRVYRVLTSYNGIVKFCKANRFKNKLNFDEKYNKFTEKGNDMIKEISDYYKNSDEEYLEGNPVSISTIKDKKIYICGIKITKNKFANATNGKNENCSIIQFFVDYGKDEEETRKQEKFLVLSSSISVVNVAEALKEVDFSKELVAGVFKKQGNKIYLLSPKR